MNVSKSLTGGLSLRAFDASGREVGTAVAGNANVLVAVEVTVDRPGKIYFEVRSPVGETGSYFLRAWPQHDADTGTNSTGEPDGSRYVSGPLQVGEWWTRSLRPIDRSVQASADVDMYHVVGGHTDSSYEVRFTAEQVPLRLQTLDQEGAPTSTVECAPAVVCRITLTVPARERAYVSVMPATADGEGVYGGCAVPTGQSWCTGGLVERVAGPDRYATAAALAGEGGRPPTVVFVASGELFSDALSGAGAASASGAPILLVRRDSIPPATDAALRHLGSPRIVILGGSATISSAVEKALHGYGASVERWDGPDRYATSAEVSRQQFRSGVGTAYVVSGDVFPDGLSAGPAPDTAEGPVLLVTANEIPAAVATELRRLKPKRIVIIGGTATVGTPVHTALAAYTPAPVERWAGKDRFETSAAVSRHQFDHAQGVVIASGEVYADALAAAPAANWRNGPTLLVTTDRIPASIADELKRLHPQRITIVGGPATVSDKIRAELENYALMKGHKMIAKPTAKGGSE